MIAEQLTRQVRGVGRGEACGSPGRGGWGAAIGGEASAGHRVSGLRGRSGMKRR